MEILQMSLSASVLILFVSGVRRFFGKKVSPAILNLLWGIVCCKLLLPFSPFSVLERLIPVKAVEQGPFSGADTFLQIPKWQAPGGIVFEPVAMVSEASAIGRGLWLAGAVCAALYFLFAYVRCVRILRTALPVADSFAIESQTSHMARKVCVRVSDRIDSPLTYGIFHPVIVLPKEMDGRDRETLYYVFAHELAHIERWDCARKLCLTAVMVCHWFNPLVWLMYDLANRDIELACDAKVIRSAGRERRRTYAGMLLRWAEVKPQGGLLVSHLVGNFMEERIVNIMKPKKVTVTGVLLSLVMMAGAVLIYAAAPAQAQEDAENVEAVLKNAINVTEGEQMKAVTINVKVPGTGAEDDRQPNAADPTLGGIFELYTPQEYEQVVENVKKYSDGTEEDIKRMEADLERLRADNGKGEFVIYKGAFEDSYVTDDGGEVMVSFDASIVMAPEQMSRTFTAEEYRAAMADVEQFLADAVADGRATTEQKEKIMAKMQENLEKFD